MTHDMVYAILQGAFDAMGIEHFHPEELVPVRREPPPLPLLGNILPTMLVLERLRVTFDSPVHINSAWRPAAYNRQIGGARNSQHVQFSAVDFTVRTHKPLEAAKWLEGCTWKDQIGVGRYDTFTHIDTRHWEGRPQHGKPAARWDNRRNP